MYRYLAGLQPVEPGYRHTRIEPRPGGGFTSARAAHESLYGLHVAGWRLVDGRLEVEAQVPGNTSATVMLPDGTRTEVGPGTHTFQAPYAASGRAVLA
jgi:alpha-L-rhamnosidase